MKIIVRLIVALFGAIFGSLLLSVQACSYATQQTDRPRWADPPAVLAAAVGVALRARWARYLVYALTGAFVATWGYTIWVAANAGYFQSSGPGRSILSLMPGVAFVLVGVFCCYVVTPQQPFAHTRQAAVTD
jgi:hypothetical protein